MAFDFTILRRLGASALAVAFAVGAVVVMRIVAREIAGLGAAKSTARAEARIEYGANAPRVFDLASIVPADLHYTVLGRACRRREIPLLMPRVLAIKVKENEAAAAGWKLLHETGRRLKIYREKTATSVYQTPEGRIMSRRFYGTGPDTSTMVEIELPDLREFGVTPGGDIAERPGLEPSIAEIASAQSVAVKYRLPPVLRDVAVGHPLFTVLERRGEGSVFNLTMIELGAKALVERKVEDLLEKGGWRLIDSKVRLTYVRENLTLAAYCDVDQQEQGATIVSYRISDDEVRVTNKRSENENG